MDKDEKREIQKAINKLKEALTTFDSCPDRQRAWEMNFGNAVVFALDDLEKILKGYINREVKYAKP